LLCLAASIAGASATPANKAALEHHYDRFLPKALKDCTTCHLPSPIKNPERLADFPHNNFGARLRELSSSVGSGLPARLSATAGDDSDRDGVPNETEILLGTNPGDAGDRPSESVLKLAP